jgi:hypothetical protein
VIRRCVAEYGVLPIDEDQVDLKLAPKSILHSESIHSDVYKDSFDFPSIDMSTIERPDGNGCESFQGLLL